MQLGNLIQNATKTDDASLGFFIVVGRIARHPAGLPQ
jgi:hypothetical protein